MALQEHADVVAQFGKVVQQFGASDWQRSPAAGRWSAAALTVHVCQAYELGCVAAGGAPGMRLVSPRPVAWLSRHLVLPLLLATRTFPREAPAPAEVLPDHAVAEDLSVADGYQRFMDAAESARVALTRPDARPFTHAYFGTLPPRMTLRLLSAHTRHHTAGLHARLATPA